MNEAILPYQHGLKINFSLDGNISVILKKEGVDGRQDSYPLKFHLANSFCFLSPNTMSCVMLQKFTLLSMPGFPILKILILLSFLTKMHFLSLYIKIPFIYILFYRKCHVSRNIISWLSMQILERDHLNPHCIFSFSLGSVSDRCYFIFIHNEIIIFFSKIMNI